MKKILREQFEKALKEVEKEAEINVILNEAVETISLLEFHVYKKIPASTCSYREDKADLNTNTLKHSILALIKSE